jgi:aminotransferase
LFSQQSALAALEQDVDTRPAFLEIYERRRAVMSAGLTEIGIPQSHMGGGLFMWADVSRFGVGAERFCYDLLKETGVLMFPGNSFGDRWTDWVRISLLAPEEQIAEAVDRMRTYVERLS